MHSKMIMGGAEVVLLRLFKALLSAGVKLKLVLYKRGGELLDEVPSEVDISYRDVKSISECLREEGTRGAIRAAFVRLRIRAAKTYEKECVWCERTSAPLAAEENDTVICWTPHNYMCVCAVARSRAKRKILWVHDCMFDEVDHLEYERKLTKFDVIVCVSKSVKDYYDRRFPVIADRTIVIYNLIDADEIRQKSLEPPLVPIKKNSIVTVGRLSKEKGQQLIPEILRCLLDEGHDVYWYLVGDGPLREMLELEIQRLKLEGRLILLGNQVNPYPYMKACMVYVQPSFTEGYCTTTNEARVLAKPVVTTDIPCMREQFIDGQTGILTFPTVEALIQAIVSVLYDESLRIKLAMNLSMLDFGGTGELRGLYKVVNQVATNE